MTSEITVEYDTDLQQLSINRGGRSQRLELRDLQAVEKVLDFLGISYEEKLGNILTQSEQMMQQYQEDYLYKIGYENGKQFMMDKIESKYELGKPVLANERLYWMKNATENLFDIMEDMEHC